MDIIAAYQALDKSTLHLLKSVNVIKSPTVKVKKDFIRMTENPFVLTDEIDGRSRSVS